VKLGPLDRLMRPVPRDLRERQVLRAYLQGLLVLRDLPVRLALLAQAQLVRLVPLDLKAKRVPLERPDRQVPQAYLQDPLVPRDLQVRMVK